MSDSGRVEWNRAATRPFEPEKHYLVVAPLFRGAFAVIDTDRGVLTPHQLP